MQKVVCGCVKCVSMWSLFKRQVGKKVFKNVEYHIQDVVFTVSAQFNTCCTLFG